MAPGHDILAHLHSRDTAYVLVSRAPYARIAGAAVFHTYSAYARGTEPAVGTYPLLDLTALGRQEDWEEPSGQASVSHPADPSFS